MSEREQVLEIIDAMPEYRLAGLLAFLRTFEETPNDETLAAFEELDRGGGCRFSGKTEQLFEELLGA